MCVCVVGGGGGRRDALALTLKFVPFTAFRIIDLRFWTFLELIVSLYYSCFSDDHLSNPFFGMGGYSHIIENWFSIVL